MHIDNAVFRKIQAGPVMVLMLLLLAGCQHGDRDAEASEDILNSGSVEETQEPKYISETLKEDCLLCGGGKGTLLPLYWGQENMAVISLNSFDLAYIEINRYDDYGRLIEKPAKGTSITRTSTGEGGFTFTSSEDSNRGYARCDLYFNDDEILDVEQASAHMCTDCLNRAIDDGWGDDPTGMAVINFSTGEVRILRENLLAFQFGDFFVSCKARRYEMEENDLEMALLIFYCPKRYGD